ncbi:peptidylprolyl isomerase [Paenibacillus tritici]|jgi:foldase protein PrsA|uniref:Peptidylprolyl isomerase n=1 Tax=Paenibacillus tritici TaxID=1873425 RepID=A0ABX2DZI8_9BACL|nr:peptidylprolyl isomerase [Paenibacillus tritici]NQX49562.1 peptidylprolyl isomerase [Paenibacillus tritici]
MSLNKKTWKVLLVSLAAAVSFSMLAGCGNKDSEKAVATYKGGTITEKEFNLDTRVMKFLSPEQAQYLEIDMFKESILKQEVAFEHLAGQASEEAKKAAEKEVDTQIDTIKGQLGDKYKSTLKDQDLSESDLRTYMQRVLTVYQDMLLKVTDEQVKSQYEATKADYTVATLRHVLVGLTDSAGKERTDADALKRAQEAKAKLEGGADFAAVAKEYSDDPGSKDTGGEYKDKPLANYVAEFKAAAQTLPLNKISDPIKTSFGYHVMKVEARKDTTFDTLTAEQLKAVKNSAASASLETFLEKNLDSLEIKINLPKSSAAPAESGATATPAPGADTPAATEVPAATEAAK